MTPKEFLRQYEEAAENAERLRAEYQAELNKVDNIRSTLSGDGMPHGSGKSNPTEAEAIRLAAKANDYAKAEAEALKIQQKVFSIVIQVSGIEGQILTEHYINLRKWSEVSEIIHMSDSGMFDAHNRALRKVQTILKKRSESE